MERYFIFLGGKNQMVKMTTLEAQTFTASMQVSSVRKINTFYLQ